MTQICPSSIQLSPPPLEGFYSVPYNAPSEHIQVGPLTLGSVNLDKK